LNFLERFRKQIHYNVSAKAANDYLRAIGDHASVVREAGAPLKEIGLIARRILFINLCRAAGRIDEETAIHELVILEKYGAPLTNETQKRLSKIPAPSGIYVSKRQAMALSNSIKECELLADRAAQVFLVASSLRHFAADSSDNDSKIIWEKMGAANIEFYDQLVKYFGSSVKYLKKGDPVTLHRLCLLEFAKVQRIVIDLTEAIIDASDDDRLNSVRMELGKCIDQVVKNADKGIEKIERWLSFWSPHANSDAKLKNVAMMKSLLTSFSIEKEIAEVAQRFCEPHLSLSDIIPIEEEMLRMFERRSFATAERIATLSA